MSECRGIHLAHQSAAHCPGCAEVAALRALNEPMPESYACERCGRRDGMDASLPHDVWAAVSGGQWHILCLWCIDALAAEKGLSYTAKLYFVGRAGLSQLPSTETDCREVAALQSENSAYRARLATAENRAEYAERALGDLRLEQARRIEDLEIMRHGWAESARDREKAERERDELADGLFNALGVTMASRPYSEWGAEIKREYDQRIAHIESERDAAREALRDYGRHGAGCEAGLHEALRCRCRWPEVRREVLGDDVPAPADTAP